MPSQINLTVEIQSLKKEIASVEAALSAAVPEGRLISRKQDNGEYSYTRKVRMPNGKQKEIYIRQEHRKDAEIMARKMYLEQTVIDLNERLNALTSLLELQTGESRAEQLLRRHPGLKPLLAGRASSGNAELEAWKHAPYNRNLKYPEQLIYPTVVPGLMVRSKSEADIIARLEYYGVPYHYDELLEVDGTLIAMDLICRNLHSAMFWYWDHRGMMDNESYIKKTLYCEGKFYNAGIIPWVNMIVTTETRNHPLDILWADQVIRYYLL